MRGFGIGLVTATLVLAALPFALAINVAAATVRRWGKTAGSAPFVWLALLAMGCGGATTAISSETLTTTCEVAIDQIADSYEAGELEQDEATAAVECARATCLRLHRVIEDSVEGDEEDQ